MANHNKKCSADPKIPQAEAEDENNEDTRPPLPDSTHDGSTNQLPVPIALNNSNTEKGPYFKKPTASTSNSNYKTDGKNGSTSSKNNKHSAKTDNKIRVQKKNQSGTRNEGLESNADVDPRNEKPTSADQSTVVPQPQIITPRERRVANHTVTKPEQNRGQAYQLPLQANHENVYGPYINPLARNSNRPRANLEPHQIMVPMRNRVANHTITTPDQSPSVDYHRNPYGPHVNQYLNQTSVYENDNVNPLYTVSQPQRTLQMIQREANHTITDPYQLSSTSDQRRGQERAIPNYNGYHLPLEEYPRNLFGPHVNRKQNEGNNIIGSNNHFQPQSTNPNQFSSSSGNCRDQGSNAAPNPNHLTFEEYHKNQYFFQVNQNLDQTSQNDDVNARDTDSQLQSRRKAATQTVTKPDQTPTSGHHKDQGSNAAPNANQLLLEEYYRNPYVSQGNQYQNNDVDALNTDLQVQTIIQSRRRTASHTVTRPDQLPGVSGRNRGSNAEREPRYTVSDSNTDELTIEQFRRNQLYAQINQYFKQSETMIRRKRKSDNNALDYPDKCANGSTSREIVEALRKNRKQLYQPYINPYLNQNPNEQSSRRPSRNQESNTFTERRNALQALNTNQSTLENSDRMPNNHVRTSYYQECVQLFFKRTNFSTTTGMVNENSQMVTQTPQNTENPDGNVSTSREFSNEVNAQDKNHSILNGTTESGNSIMDQLSTSGLQLDAPPATQNNPKTETNQVNNDMQPNDMEQRVQPKEELVKTVHEPKLEVETVPNIKIENSSKLKGKSLPNKKTTSTEKVKVEVDLINNISELGRLSLVNKIDQIGIKNKKKKKAFDNPAKKLRKVEDSSYVKVAKKKSDESKTEKLMCKIALKDCPKIISLLQSKMGENKKDTVNINDCNVKPEPVSEVKKTRKQEKTKHKERKEKRDVVKKETTFEKSRVKKEPREFNDDLAVVQNVINEEDMNDAVINEVRSIDPVTGKLQSCYFYIQKENSDVKEEKKVEDSTASTVECPITDPQQPYDDKGKKRSTKPMETDENLAIPGCSYIITETGEKKENNNLQENSVTNKTAIKKVFVITQVSNFHPITGELESCYYYFKENNDVETVENNDIKHIKEEKKADEVNYVKKENENGSDTEEVSDINQVVQACYCESATEETAQLPSKPKKKKKSTDN